MLVTYSTPPSGLDAGPPPRYVEGVSKSRKEQPDAELSFEQAIERLEAIVERVEQGEIGLEQAIAEYERGVGLVKRCREILARAEQRVTELSGHLSETDPADNSAPRPRTDA